MITLTSAQAALVSGVSFDIQTAKVNSEIYFKVLVTGVKPSELGLLSSVNLSRGGLRNFRLDNLSAHNGSGATWDGKSPKHTYAQEIAYVNRVSADIANAVAASKLAIAKARTPAPVYVAPKPATPEFTSLFKG